MTMKRFTASVFCENAGHVLLIWHKKLDLWLPVGGKLKGDETPLQAAMREGMEETGRLPIFLPDPSAPAGTPAGLIGYEEHVAGPEMHLNFVFHAKLESRDVQSNGEWDTARWAALDHPKEWPKMTPRNVIDCLSLISRRPRL